MATVPHMLSDKVCLCLNGNQNVFGLSVFVTTEGMRGYCIHKSSIQSIH